MADNIKNIPAGPDAPYTLKPSQQTKINKYLEETGRRGNAELQDELKEVKNLEVKAKAANRQAAASWAATRARIEGQIGQRATLTGEDARWLRRLAQRENERAAANATRYRMTMGRLMGSAAAEWARLVATAHGGVPITSQRAFMSVIARALDDLNRAIFKGDRIAFTGVLGKYELWGAYKNAIAAMGQNTHFTLYLNDNEAIPELLRTQARMKAFALILKDEVAEIAKVSLWEAVQKCVNGLSPVAWPPSYTTLLFNRLQLMNEPGGIGGFELKGEGSLTGWWIAVDFEKIFGTHNSAKADIDAATHFGAVLKTSVTGKIMRQGLPSRGEEVLMEPDPRTRYKYWKAMAAGKRVFYGGYATKAKAIKGRKAGINAKLADLQERQGYIEKRLLSKKGAHAHRKDRLKENLAEQKSLRGERNRVKRETKPIRIPPGQWQATIAARVAFWEKNRIAPVWTFLEFGQLNWQPIIPPRMLTYRFLEIARKKIALRVQKLMDAELRQSGINRSYGSTMLTATGTPIRFGPHKGQSLKRGTFLGSTDPESKGTAGKELLAAMGRNEITTIRNIEEARQWEQPPGPPPPQPWVQNFGTRMYLLKKEREREARLNATSGGSTYTKYKPPRGEPVLTPAQKGARTRALKRIEAERRAGASLGLTRGGYLQYLEDQKALLAKAKNRGKKSPKKKPTARKEPTGFVGNIDMTHYSPINRGRKPKRKPTSYDPLP